ncbi:MAG TPA: hypothetical protein VMI53_08520, partial [Opitutaceae bacterium]|nr:hypothetical protein [Opitutaceae bacterium]
MKISDRLISLFQTIGLTPLMPVVRLCVGEDPREQLAQLGRMIGLPLLGFGLFLVAWAVTAANVKTSIGTVPGPVQVWQQAVGLVREHQA